MSATRLAVAVLLATAAAGAGASSAPAHLSPADVDACASSLHALERSQYENFKLAEHCPNLARDLAGLVEAGDSALVGTDVIGVEGVRDVSAILDGFRFEVGDASNFELDFEGLDALLDEVLIVEDSGDDLWERFLRWLEENFDDERSPRLARFLDWLVGLDAPPWLGEVLIKTSTVLIVLLALIVVGNELRLSGILRARRRERVKGLHTGVVAPAGKQRARSFDELRGLPPKALAAAIVEMVTTAFAERGWLSRSESLTNGELLEQLRECEETIVGPFSTLLHAVESIVYGDRMPDDRARRRLIASAGALITRTRGASAPAGRATP